MSTEAIDPRFADYLRDNALTRRLENLGVDKGATLQGINKALDRSDYRVAVVAGRWHNYIVDRLLAGTLGTLNEFGVSDRQIDFVQAPGAYEFSLVVKALLEQENYHAVIVLGVVIKGDTPHFDYVAGECSRCLADISVEEKTPVGFGVLTVNNVEQALVRSELGDANKGREATLAVLEVADLLQLLDNQ